jgi:hypothetical protein
MNPVYGNMPFYFILDKLSGGSLSGKPILETHDSFSAWRRSRLPLWHF